MNQWIFVLSWTKAVIPLSDTSFMSPQCLKDKVGSTTNSFRAVLKHDRHLYRRGVSLPRLIIFIMQRAAYKLPRFRFNTCTDFEYCLLNRLVWLCMIVGLNCGSLPGKVLFHKVIKDEDILYHYHMFFKGPSSLAAPLSVSIVCVLTCIVLKTKKGLCDLALSFKVFFLSRHIFSRRWYPRDGFIWSCGRYLIKVNRRHLNTRYLWEIFNYG